MPPTVLPSSDWSRRTKAESFQHLIRLSPGSATPNTFTSTSPAYPPTPSHRTYGGHVIAQAAWAAAYTVPYGLHVHSITGYFLSIGDTRHAFTYRVRRIRDGGVYAQRAVDVFQDESKGAMFTCIVSFKRDESKLHQVGHKKRRRNFGHQQLDRGWLEKEYGNVLNRKRFEEWPVCQGMDGLWPTKGLSVQEWKQRGDVFPGLDMRKVDMGGYNGTACEGAVDDDGDVARRWRLLVLYRLMVDERDSKAKSSMETSKRKTAADDELNLHACAHIYASDRNSLFLTQRALGFENFLGQIGSLSHTVNFHGGASTLRMLSEDGRPKDFVQESWMSNSGDDRVCHESRIWDRETGKILASTVQDGMMRMPVAQEEGVIDGDLILRREAKL